MNTVTKADSKIQQDVTTELKWDPSVTTNELSISVKDGIVSLRGSVPHYSERSAAEAAVQRVCGVRAVANELEVKILGMFEKTDEDVAKAAVSALEWNYQAPDNVKVTVTNGWITLKGQADWEFERTAAYDAIRHLMGVKGVSNEISLKVKTQPSDIKTRIEEALKRSAETDAKNIRVSIDGSCVTLSGDVHSFAESEDARFAAWSAPGVMIVQNDLRIAA